MIVIDANAALAISLGLEISDALLALQEEDEEIIAPTLLCNEVTNALTKYVRGRYINVEEAVACGRDALALVDRFIDDESLWVESMTESLRLGHSSYDMFYYVLALRENAALFTLDKKLQELCFKTGISCIKAITI